MLTAKLHYVPGPLKTDHRKINLIQKDTCTPIFIVALFIIAKIWQQGKCPSTDKRTKKTWYTHTHTHTHTQEYYSAMKKNEMPFIAT